MNTNFVLRFPSGELSLHRSRIMGILNVTPDSFSDGGDFIDPETAISRAWDMVDEGADMIDVGAESSRPGAEPVDQTQEIQRLTPILEALHAENYPLAISLDSYKPEVVLHFAQKGWIDVVNDITGLRNEQMLIIARENELAIIAMHMLGTPQTMQNEYAYTNVLDDVLAYFSKLKDQYDLSHNVVFDPGIGFGKSVAHNLQLINQLDAFHQLEAPILLGASRKSFMGKTLSLDVDERMIPSVAVACMAVDRGCHIIRAHDVKETKLAITMAEHIKFGANASKT